MAWPKNLDDVTVYGFDRSLLPIFREAIENKHVKWVPDTAKGFAESSSEEFDYLGFRYRINEYCEVVQNIEKVARMEDVIDPEDPDEDRLEDPFVGARQVAVSIDHNGDVISKSAYDSKEYGTW